MKAVKEDSKNQMAFLQELLSQIRTDDAKVKSFIEQEINAKQSGGKQKGVTREVIRRLKIQNKKLLDQVALLKEEVKQTRSDRNEATGRLTDLMKLNKSLAEALGSCPACWGEDQKCANCAGNGSPGWRTINRRLFNIYILPALEKKYGLRRNKR